LIAVLKWKSLRLSPISCDVYPDAQLPIAVGIEAQRSERRNDTSEHGTGECPQTVNFHPVKTAFRTTHEGNICAD